MPNSVLLFGHLLPEACDERWLAFDIEPQMGDARLFRLAGQIKFLKNSCSYDLPGSQGGYYIVRVPEHVARYHSEQAGNVRSKKKGKR
jgi:hypothetical protein